VPQVELRSSRIAGQGLFAVDAILADEVALELEAVGPGPLNHSCDPNLGWADDHTLVAIRDIAVADELTIDYATVITDPDFAMMCHCETYRCRQMIEGNDWQIPQLQKRYAGRWSPAVQRRIDESLS
jgi:SET domain-containing protein